MPALAHRSASTLLTRPRVDDVCRRRDGSYEARIAAFPNPVRLIFRPPIRLRQAGVVDLVTFDGEQRALDLEEKQILAAEIDRRTSGHALGALAEKAGLELLYALLQDPGLDPRWHAPNVLLDAALRRGNVTSILRGRGHALGPKSGPIDTITVTLGHTIEQTIYREIDPSGPVRVSKQMADGQLVALSLEERLALRARLAARQRLRRV